MRCTFSGIIWGYIWGLCARFSAQGCSSIVKTQMEKNMENQVGNWDYLPGYSRL